ncbi:MAG: ComF family protein [Candidatus Omnitrophica bacterium]|nr:ComF family protein [Candidatus Omnitrophota bacterium]
MFNIPPFCPKCSRHLGKHPKYSKCKNCSRSELFFDFAWCACFFEDPLKELIHKFKYDQKTQLSDQFCKLMIHFIQEYCMDIEQFDLIMPIPLHPARKRERGYNQSFLLASKISKSFNINLNINLLIKVKNTKNQSLLSKKERWTNITDAFKIKNPNAVKNKSILLIDDLLTTGATSSEAAKVLKISGAKTVGVFTLAGAQLER